MYVYMYECMYMHIMMYACTVNVHIRMYAYNFVLSIYSFMYVCMYLATNIKVFLVHQIRLINGANERTGRVEVYTNSTGGLDNARWGTICDDNWDIQDARVICRQLGYPDAVAPLLSAHYGHGSGPVWLNNINCLGIESDLFACGHNGLGNHSCEHDDDVSVECSG